MNDRPSTADAYEDLRQKEVLYRSIVEASIDGVLRVDRHLVVTFANRKFAEQVGADDAAELVGSPLARFSVRSEDELRQLVHNAERMERARPTPMKRLDGSTLPVLSSAKLLYDADGEFDGFISVTSDHSERHRLEAELRNKNKIESVARLASGLAHEMNTPLQFLQDNLRFIERSVAMLSNRVGSSLGASSDDEKLTFVLDELPQSIADMKTGIDRVAALVSTMKSFGGNGETEMGLVDVSACVRNTIDVIQREFAVDPVTVTAAADDVPFVRGDAGGLNEAIYHVIQNAVLSVKDRRARQSGFEGCVQCTWTVEAASVTLTVEDDGMGISADVFDSVFDPFFTTRNVGDGSGQGLAIVRAIIVERCGGDVWFDPTAVGGARCNIRLPRPI